MMRRCAIFLFVTFVIGVDPISQTPNTTADLSFPDMTTSAVAAKARRNLVHCEISVGDADRRSEMLLPPTMPTNVSGSGCEDPDAVTSLTLKMAGDVDLFPVCRFSAGVERLALVGRLANRSLASLNCFRNVRHVMVRHADVEKVRPSLIHDNFRSVFKY